MNRETTYYGVIWVKHCINCNAVIYDDKAEICPICKKPLGESQLPPEPPTVNIQAKKSSDIDMSTRLIAASSYLTVFLPFIIILPIILRRKNLFVRSHIIRGVVLSVIMLIEAVVSSILRTMFPSVTTVPKVVKDGIQYTTYLSPTYHASGLIIHWIFLTTELIIIVLFIINIVKALRGKAANKQN